MTHVDDAFAAVRGHGPPDVGGFARWMSLVERPLRASLRRFARAVDVEVVLQETFLRMWIAVGDARELTGENASLRFALRMARLVALEEVRRLRHERLVPIDELEPSDEPSVLPVPIRDEGLLHAIRDCIDRLSGSPKRALLLRLHGGHRHSDRFLASRVGMQLNTFLQNVVRARRSVAECLQGKGL